jgi:hypothetical protein
MLYLVISLFSSYIFLSYYSIFLFSIAIYIILLYQSIYIYFRVNNLPFLQGSFQIAVKINVLLAYFLHMLSLLSLTVCDSQYQLKMSNEILQENLNEILFMIFTGKSPLVFITLHCYLHHYLFINHDVYYITLLLTSIYLISIPSSNFHSIF